MRAKRIREHFRGMAVEQRPGEHEALANEEEGRAGRRHLGQFWDRGEVHAGVEGHHSPREPAQPGGGIHPWQPLSFTIDRCAGRADKSGSQVGLLPGNSARRPQRLGPTAQAASLLPGGYDQIDTKRPPDGDA